MPASNRPVTLVVGAAVFFAAGFGLSHWLSLRDASPPSTAAPVATVAARPAAPAPAPTPDTYPRSPTTGTAPSADPPPLLAAPPAGEGGPVSGEQIERIQDRRRAELAAAFASETIDAAWSPVAEQGLLAAAASEEASLAEQTPVDFRSECRSRTCRIDARFAPESDADGWVALFLLASADTLGGADSLVTRRQDGSFDVTIYGRRP